MMIMMDLIMKVTTLMTMVKTIMIIYDDDDEIPISIGSFLLSPQDKSPEKGRHGKMCKSIIRCFVSLFFLLVLRTVHKLLVNV